MSRRGEGRTPVAPSGSAVLTVQEASTLLQVNEKTLYAEIKAGRFPAIRLGRVIRISRTVLDAALEQGHVAATRASAKR